MSKSFHTQLGKRIRKLREQNDLTLESLANQIGSAKSYVWKLENRTPESPSANKLKQIASVFGMSLAELLEEEPANNDDNSDVAQLVSVFNTLDPDRKRLAMKVIKAMKHEAIATN